MSTNGAMSGSKISMAPTPAFITGHTALILNHAQSSAHLLKEGFWDWYMNHDGAYNLGSAESEEYPYNNGKRQDFSKGWLEWNGSSVLAHYGLGVALIAIILSLSTPILKVPKFGIMANCSAHRP